MDGALTVPPSVQAVPPVRNTSASSMQSPPSQRRRHQRHHLVARVRPPRGIAQVEALPDEFGQAWVPRQGGPEGAARHATKRRSSKVIWIQVGWLRGSIYWVLLFRGRFFATKPLSPEAQEHLDRIQIASMTTGGQCWAASSGDPRPAPGSPELVDSHLDLAALGRQP